MSRVCRKEITFFRTYIRYRVFQKSGVFEPVLVVRKMSANSGRLYTCTVMTRARDPNARDAGKREKKLEHSLQQQAIDVILYK